MQDGPRSICRYSRRYVILSWNIKSQQPIKLITHKDIKAESEMQKSEPPTKNGQEEHREHYSKAQFWDDRYVEKGGFFDWYAEYPELKHCFQTQYGMQHEDSILMVGCGNSKLSQQMYDAGYRHIVNVDISPSVIEQMKKVSPDMEWLVMDCTNMDFKDNSFDYVIDKGTMDALIAGRDLTPSYDLLKECSRVTKEEGQLILITYGSPEGRKKVFEAALPFVEFDYFFTYINLNDMSTMINLMRNNLVGPNGEKVDKQEALQRSLKQFMMIKVMRHKRSKDKQFVIWENFAKKSQSQSTLTTQQPQPTTISEISIPEQLSSNDADNTQAAKDEQTQSKLESQEKQLQQKKSSKQSDAQQSNIKYLSKPQKQTYVYAYSVKKKFGYDFKPENYAELKPDQVSYEGRLESCRFEIKGSEEVQVALVQSLKYFSDKTIAHFPSKYVRSQEKFSDVDKQKQQTVRVFLTVGNDIDFKLKVLRKTNILLKVQFSQLSLLNHDLDRLGRHLLEKSGLELHPCPKSFSLLSILRTRMNVKSSSELLKKYWFPTYQIKSIDCESKTAQVILSIPPVADEILLRVQQLIEQSFGKTTANVKLSIQAVKKGFVAYPELRIFTLINMTSLSFNSGRKLVVDMEDFWEDEQKEKSEIEHQGFNVRFNEVEVPGNLLTRILMHLLALY